VCTLEEKLEDEYLEIPGDSVKRVFAGQYACFCRSVFNLSGLQYWFLLFDVSSFDYSMS
jgi:hypothetical protein